MGHRILITGASGYLGGSLLAGMVQSQLRGYEKLYALVRSDTQAEAVSTRYSAVPLSFDIRDETAVHEAVTTNLITVVFFLVDAMSAESQRYFIAALAEVGKQTGKTVHFLHTSGAKLFSSHAGAPCDGLLSDDASDLYDLQKAQVANIAAAQGTLEVNTTVIELGDKSGVRVYIFVPCIVYGKGTGFGNTTSIQTVAICRVAKALRRVCDVNQGEATWPVCHISDNTNLYIDLLRAILSDNTSLPPWGRNGFYLAASGLIAWSDLYAAMAKALAQRGAVEDDEVRSATDSDLEQMAAALNCPKELVALQVGGTCTFTARNGAKIGWKAQYPPEHALQSADSEVEIILATL